MPAGRPTLYKTEYVEQAYKYALLGATDEEMAAFFDIDTSTLYLWKNEHPEFSESIKEGKERADANVAKSLYKRACGFENDEVEIFQYKGNPVIVPVKKYYPPDTGAAMAWLNNRRRQNWKARQALEMTGANGGPIQTVSRISTLSDEDLDKMLQEAELAEENPSNSPG